MVFFLINISSNSQWDWRKKNEEITKEMIQLCENENVMAWSTILLTKNNLKMLIKGTGVVVHRYNRMFSIYAAPGSIPWVK